MDALCNWPRGAVRPARMRSTSAGDAIGVLREPGKRGP